MYMNRKILIIILIKKILNKCLFLNLKMFIITWKNKNKHLNIMKHY